MKQDHQVDMILEKNVKVLETAVAKSCHTVTDVWGLRRPTFVR